MARLKSLAPRVAQLAPRIGSSGMGERERTQHRDRTQHWRAWYKTARWQKLRWSVLVRDGFTCQRCGLLDGSKRALHCDHVEPHRGDEAKFWAGPFMTLCASCHNSGKQSEERQIG